MKRDKVYKTGASFRTALEDRLGKIAMEEGVDLQRIRRQVSFDQLLARLGSAPDSPSISTALHTAEPGIRLKRFWEIAHLRNSISTLESAML